ncbi:MAG: metalloregulator ArsR/SmtB family transcription factor [Bacillota bacterium]
MINVTDHTQNAKVFKALCDSKRLVVLEILRRGEHCACDIIDETGIAQSALSYHMKILVESGIVESWQVGKWTHYKISRNGKETAFSLIEQLLYTE